VIHGYLYRQISDVADNRTISKTSAIIPELRHSRFVIAWAAGWERKTRIMAPNHLGTRISGGDDPNDLKTATEPWSL
jgi:hypothetical protein